MTLQEPLSESQTALLGRGVPGGVGQPTASKAGPGTGDSPMSITPTDSNMGLTGGDVPMSGGPHRLLACIETVTVCRPALALGSPAWSRRRRLHS